MIDIIDEITQSAQELEPEPEPTQGIITGGDETAYGDLAIKVRHTQSIPSSPAVDMLYRASIAGKYFGELPSRLKGKSKAAKVTTSSSGKARTITKKTSSSETTLNILDIDKLPAGRHNIGARKILVYLLGELANTGIEQGSLYIDELEIKSSALVEAGIYKDTIAAKKGLFKAWDTLLSNFKVYGYIESQKGKKELARAAVLFPNIEKTRTGARIKVDEKFNWKLLTQFFMPLSKTYFSLPCNAADLFYYIHYMARQRLNDLKGNYSTKTHSSSFKLTYNSIKNFIGLPDLEAATNPTAQIINPIREAIGNILDNAPDEIEIENHITEGASPAYNLEHAYIVITLKGEPLEQLLKVKQDIDTRTSSKIKRIQRAKDKALQKHYEKQLEASDDTQQQA